MMTKDLYRVIVDELGKSRPTASTWISNNSYPAEACIKIEQLTNGEVTAQSLRPDIFLPNNSELNLASVVKNLPKVEATTTYLLTGVLSYFESQQPDVYNDIINSLKETDFGKQYLEQRTLYTNEKL